MVAIPPGVAVILGFSFRTEFRLSAARLLLPDHSASPLRNAASNKKTGSPLPPDSGPPSICTFPGVSPSRSLAGPSSSNPHGLRLVGFAPPLDLHSRFLPPTFLHINRSLSLLSVGRPSPFLCLSSSAPCADFCFFFSFWPPFFLFSLLVLILFQYELFGFSVRTRVLPFAGCLFPLNDPSGPFAFRIWSYFFFPWR